MNPAPLDDTDCEPIFDLLKTRAGLVFRPDQKQEVAQSVRRAMDRAGESRLSSFCRLLASESQVFFDLVDKLVVGETYFFRDADQFDHLRQVVLPQILSRRRSEHPLRIWSAGCASGEEPYSLAMLLQRMGLSHRAQIVASDISPQALRRAERGVYRPWSLRGEGAAGARPWLFPSDAGYQVVEKIQKQVRFFQHNLALDDYPSLHLGIWRMDLILCRNVLIYLDPQTISHAARRLYESLAKGGWLLTASTDPPLDKWAPFHIHAGSSAVCYHRDSQCSSNVGWSPNVNRSENTHRPDDPPETSDNEIPQAAARPSPPRPDRQTNRQSQKTPSSKQVDSNTPADDHRTWIQRVQQLANTDVAKAEEVCGQAADRFPLNAHLHYLYGVLKSQRGDDVQAAKAVQRALYLQGDMAIGHYTLGAIMQRLGDLRAARRAFRNAHQIAADRPAGDSLCFAEDETAGWLAAAALRKLRLIEGKSD